MVYPGTRRVEVRNPPGWEAAVFDLDGVLTFTATIHLAAWTSLFDEYLRGRAARSNETFVPFTEDDYRRYLDGRPRYDGVRTFLASRDITLPEGEPEDPPDLETVCGLGNRKNLLFHQYLSAREVPTDPAAVALVRALRANGVPVAIASSSRNAVTVLQRAALADVADTVVDGLVSEEAGFEGKPAPDIFLEALRRLGVGDPAHAVVVEDADSGVEAGRRGGFGLVIGVDRGGRATALREHGADWIVHDFSDVTPGRLQEYFDNRGHRRANALARWTDLTRELEGRKPAVFLDYDGTLTPIVGRPELAVMSDEMRNAVESVARVWPTTIVSGRGREDVTALVGLDQVNYAGSHGFDIAGPRASSLRLEVATEFAPLLADASQELRERTSVIAGALVENKRFALAVHYRQVRPDEVDEVERIVDQALASRPRLRKSAGKKVFELRPDLDWDKGKAVLWLLEKLALDTPGTVPMYIGDDVTDEDAFRALAGRGIGILVSDLPRPTAARYAVQDVEEVGELLRRLAGLRESAP